MKKNIKIANTIDLGISKTNKRGVFSFNETRQIIPNAERLLEKGIILPGRGYRNELQSVWTALGNYVMDQIEQTNVRSLLVASPTGGTGSTTTCVNLAIQIARRSGRTALLLEMNFHNPVIANLFGINNSTGLADCLEGDARFKDIIFSPLDCLSVAPAGQVQGNISELLTSSDFGELMDDVQGRYQERVLIIDAPPVLESDDIVYLSSEVDAYLLVTKSRYTRQSQIIKSQSVLRSINEMGIVLNDS